MRTRSAAQALGTGVTFTAPLTKAHAFGEVARDLGTGVTLSAPLTKAHAAGSTVNGPTTGLISDSPQGQIVMVLNNDQDGLDYPAPKWGTDHYLNDLVNGGVGPWFNNINATPIVNTGTIYSADGFARLQHNLPNVVAFRNSVATAVAAGVRRSRAEVQLQRPAGEPGSAEEHRLGAGQPGRPDPARVLAWRPGAVLARCSTTAPAAPTRCRSATAGSRRSATSASTTRTRRRSSAATRTRTRPVTRASRRCRACSARTPTATTSRT